MKKYSLDKIKDEYIERDATLLICLYDAVLKQGDKLTLFDISVIETGVDELEKEKQV